MKRAVVLLKVQQYDLLRKIVGFDFEMPPASGAGDRLCLHIGPLFKLNLELQPDKDGVVAAVISLSMSDGGSLLSMDACV